MRRQPSNLVVVSILAVACAAITVMLTAVPVVRMVAALPLVLFLPGYAITVACLPRRSLDRVARLLVSLGLSVAITILLSLILYWLRISLQTMTWAIALATVTLIACGIAWRRQLLVTEERSETSFSFDLSRRDVILLGLAVVIGGIAIGLARLPAPIDNVTGYTSLWLIPARDGQVASYEIGITSQEFETVTYRLQVMADGRVVQEWPELKLAPGETWTSSIALPADRVNTGSIEAVLYRLDNPNAVYRQVKLQRQG
jgi:uncharacterized membrane protein